jgi:hypothetical protein
MKKALIVGINDYPNSPLGGCVNDANAIRTLLESHGDGSPNFNVKMMTSPLSAGKKARVCEAYACALVLSGRRAKKPIHDGSQKNELNGYKTIVILLTIYNPLLPGNVKI